MKLKREHRGSEGETREFESFFFCLFFVFPQIAKNRQQVFQMEVAHLFVTPVIYTVSRFFASTRSAGRWAGRAAGRPAERPCQADARPGEDEL